MPPRGRRQLTTARAALFHLDTLGGQVGQRKNHKKIG
jgi:hypothetical protein